MTQRIECNPFVLRQTEASRFSHYVPVSGDAADTWRELTALVERYFGVKRLVRRVKVPKLKAGTVLGVTIPLDGEGVGRFFSGIIAVDEKTPLRSFFAQRDRAQADEQPFMQTVAVGGEKAEARFVEVILYHKSVLSDEERRYTPDGATEPAYVEAEWQIISINARPTEKLEPPTPQAMARNTAAYYGLPEGAGGTPRLYTNREWMEAITFWSRHTLADPTAK